MTSSSSPLDHFLHLLLSGLHYLVEWCDEDSEGALTVVPAKYIIQKGVSVGDVVSVQWKKSQTPYSAKVLASGKAILNVYIALCRVPSSCQVINPEWKQQSETKWSDEHDHRPLRFVLFHHFCSESYNLTFWSHWPDSGVYKCFVLDPILNLWVVTLKSCGHITIACLRLTARCFVTAPRLLLVGLYWVANGIVLKQD